ncbi:hypothetical protein PIB30_016035 [Stylosanthes scabra]|uniref:Uncharacterized protein n=1 Tax=Stylosanthes scabra TaxID=79078 RepID=A0ABU6Y455_9FABA|nr:hypothetical protein [Stylosanthes scabra]
MVINSMIIALLVHSKSNPSNNLIYHIGTSLRNPIKLSDIQDIMHLYYNTKNPWLQNHEKFGAFHEKFTFNPNYTEDHEFSQNKGAKRSRLKRIINIYRVYLCFEGMYVLQ